MENVICYKCVLNGSIYFYKVYQELPIDLPDVFRNIKGVKVFDEIKLQVHDMYKLNFSGILKEGCVETDESRFKTKLFHENAQECSPEEFQRAWVYANRIQNMFMNVIENLKSDETVG